MIFYCKFIVLLKVRNMSMKSINKMKPIAAILCLTFLSACASVNGGKQSNTNYKMMAPDLKVIQADVNQKILDSSLQIKRQLELLNDTLHHKDVNGRTVGQQADYRVHSNLNIKEIGTNDVHLMVNEGRTSNNPKPDFDKIVPNAVTPEKISSTEKTSLRNANGEAKTQESVTTHKYFYSKPAQETRGLSQLPLQNNSAKVAATEIANLTHDVKSTSNSTMQSKQETTEQKSTTSDNTNGRALERKVSIEGTYKATELLKQLSNGANYRFILKGQDKNGEVTIGSKDNPFTGTIKDALISIGNGFGDKAHISVNTKNKTITLEYK